MQTFFMPSSGIHLSLHVVLCYLFLNNVHTCMFMYTCIFVIKIIIKVKINPSIYLFHFFSGIMDSILT